MGNLSERHIFQLVGTTLAIMPMTIQIPLVPNLKPLCEEAVDHCGCPTQGVVLALSPMQSRHLSVHCLVV